MLAADDLSFAVQRFHKLQGFPTREVFKPITDQGDRYVVIQFCHVLKDYAGQLLEFALIDKNKVNIPMLRLHLIAEEFSEMIEAWLIGDEVKFFDALIDLIYVIVGTGVTYDLPLGEGFDEVQRSNMTKERQPDDPQAARIRAKGPNYSAPNLVDILRRYRGV